MTPKEAFEILVKNISISTDDETWKLLTEDSKYPLKQLEEYKLVTQALTERDLYYQALCDIEAGKDVRMILERVLT